MPSIDREIVIAEQALGRAHRDLLDRVKSEPAWYALRQLQDRHRRDDPLAAVDPDVLRARLEGQLDARAPGWRHLGAIEAALAALQPCLGALPASPALIDSARGALIGGPVPRTTPQPMLGAGAEKTASILERIRSIGGNRTDPTGLPTKAQLPDASVDQAATAPRAANPIEEVRFQKIEAELEQLVRDQPGALRDAHFSPEPDTAADDRPIGLTEAVVEIVAAPEGEPTTPSEQRLAPPEAGSAGRARPAIVTLEAWGDEASVDIVLPDEPRA